MKSKQDWVNIISLRVAFSHYLSAGDKLEYQCLWNVPRIFKQPHRDPMPV